MRPITVEVLGGLGNQMFIAAFAHILQRTSGRTVQFDTSFFEHQSLREFELGTFPNLSHFHRVPSNFQRSRRIAGRVLPAQLHRAAGLFVEHGRLGKAIGFDQDWSHASGANRVRGYFQSWRYFQGREVEIASLFEPPSRVSVRETVPIPEQFIAMHVRRGDYLKSDNAAAFGLCSRSYFEAGLASLRTQLGNALPLVLFTDSAEDTDPRLLEQADHVQIAGTERSATVDMFAMAQASGLVISNSSFSWWAAFLAEMAHGAAIVAPSPWFQMAPQATPDIVRTSWRTFVI